MKQSNIHTCDREPIHVPGSIQPHGVLLVIDVENGVIVQSAGNTQALLGFSGSVLGRDTEACLGVSIATLRQRTGMTASDGPTFLGSITVGTTDLAIRGQFSNRSAVLELEPSSWPHPVAETITGIRSAAQRIGIAEDLLDACRIAATEVARVSGYDRVMVYQFLADGSGAVIAEVKPDNLPSLLNHRFPESDIPAQARELYLRNPIRVIPDVDYTPWMLTPLLNPLSGQPLDMSHCALRSISPVHVRYLKNMGVGASMSVSLLHKGKLWGLIACHNSTARAVPLEAQEVCAHIGQILSQKIAADGDTRTFRHVAELSDAREGVLRNLREKDRPGATLFELGAELLTVVPADGVAILRGDHIAAAGLVPAYPIILRLEALARSKATDANIFVTDTLGEHYAEAADIADAASGMLAVIGSGPEPITLIWFRVGQVEEINWAGNPHEGIKASSRPTGLTPRKSFETWHETVRGRSKSWAPAEIESVRIFAERVAFLLQQQHIRDLNGQLQNAAARLEVLASTDSLTELANRRAFVGRLAQEQGRIARSGGSLALLAIDVDYFKQYNDKLGHPAGDLCLRQIARALRSACRTGDLAARTGGEEFSLLAPDLTLETALNAAESLRSAIEQLGIPHPGSPTGLVTVSVGVATMSSETADDLEALHREADRALYQAKRNGRNQVAHGSDWSFV